MIKTSASETFEELVPIHVVLRIRPPSTSSKEETIVRSCLQIIPGTAQVLVGRQSDSNIEKRSFTYDKVFPIHTTQTEIYDDVASPMVSQFFQGYNATIMAYGQTFSGKTYTMGSNNHPSSSDESIGIIPRVFQDLIGKIKADENFDYITRVSFLEVYQEHVIDLLAESISREINIREIRGNIVVSGVQEQFVGDFEDMLQYLEIGANARSTGDTQMHSHSSRSHAIFTITLEQVPKSTTNKEASAQWLKNNSAEVPILRRSKLHLVDLAGSERLKRTGAEGVRLRESVKINSGLLALGNVISSLGQDKTNSKMPELHVPYRDSKLTRLLQDSLGGNSKTVMIACVSLLEEDLDETVNTLKYAYRAKKIQNKPVMNKVDLKALELNNMQQKIDILEGQLKGFETQVPSVKLNGNIDFENDDWMSYFTDQLKSRTMRGTNAIKALETTNAEKKVLAEQLDKYKIQISELELNLTMVFKNSSPISSSGDLQPDFQELLSFSAAICTGRSPSAGQQQSVARIIQQYRPEETIVIEDAGLARLDINQTIVSKVSDSKARRERRLSKLPIQDDEIVMKPLEVELRESRKYLTQIEEELSRTKNRLYQNEAIVEESSAEVARLQSTIEKLMSGADPSEFKNFSKLLSEVAVQTHSCESEEQRFPVHMINAEINQEDFDESAEPVSKKLEKLGNELTLAMKSKVELLRELSKANKDSERLRHTHADQIQRLERELEQVQRDSDRSIAENVEKDAVREKMKEDCDRKLKQQESVVNSYKSRQKDLERTIKEKHVADKRLQDNQQESERLLQQVASLKKKIKDDLEKFNETEQRKSKEIATLNKQIEDELKKSRALEVKIGVLRKKVDRKTEELAISGRKLKDQISSTSSSLKMGIPSYSMKSLHTLAEDPDSSFVDPNNEDFVIDIKPTIESSKERIVQIELRLAEILEKVESIEAALTKTGNDKESQSSQTLIRNKSILVLHIAELRTEKLKLESSFEMNVADDLIDYPALVEKFIDDQRVLDLIPKLRVCTVQESRLQVLECLDQIQRLEKFIRSEEPKEDDDRDAKIQKLEAALKIAESADILKTPESEEMIKNLERDVFYYRNANKEMKVKLREVVAANHKLVKRVKLIDEVKPIVPTPTGNSDIASAVESI